MKDRIQFHPNQAVVFQLTLKYVHVKIANLWRVVVQTKNNMIRICKSMICSNIWHKYHSWYFKIVSNFTHLTAREITYNNFEISLVVFMPNITTNHAFTNTNYKLFYSISKKKCLQFKQHCPVWQKQCMCEPCSMHPNKYVRVMGYLGIRYIKHNVLHQKDKHRLTLS